MFIDVTFWCLKSVSALKGLIKTYKTWHVGNGNRALLILTMWIYNFRDIYTVDLAIFVCLNLREFVILGLCEVWNSRIKK